LAQVSKRLLRYYDEIGLLKPNFTDPSTGYRYYSAAQMTDLNRILALKDLGLSLDQIQRMLGDQVSTDEMHGMLLMKKVEIEQTLQLELQRIRKIESRLQSIRSAEADQPLNVVIKRIEAQSVMATRTVVESFDHAMSLFMEVRHALPERTGYGLFFVMCHDHDITDRDMDLEFGCLTESRSRALVKMDNGLELRQRELPAAEMMATTVVQGALETIHTGYREIGMWIEANGYKLAGTPRELSLNIPRAADWSDLITEIQYPVAPRR
jgi:DNA-binding transcriptional MerR regulator